MRKLLIITLALFTITSCKSVKQTKALKDCSFSFTSLSDVTVNGVSIEGKKSFSDLSIMETSKISKGLMSGKMPISLTATVSITNPNDKIARLTKIDWKLVVKSNDIAEGSLEDFYEIKAHETVEVPIFIETDISKLLKLYSVKELTGMLFNLSDVNGIPSNASLKIRPYIKIGKKGVKVPAYFTVPLPTK